jgi:hemerythrin-like domain-containing protein
MQALSSITRDHRVRSQLGRALESYAASILLGRRSPGELAALVRVLTALLDERQGEKEEQVLFPWIVRRGFDFEFEPMEHCLAAHCQERYLISVLRHAAALGEQQWSTEDARRVAATAVALAQLEDNLVAEEMLELIPEIVTRFDPRALAELDGALDAFDDAIESSADPATSSAARELMSRYGESHAPAN